ncbi:hypothetical protein, partial [Pseudoflavonifractor sp. 60]|uniref:hypothetical protein n=1 Tax=Pseudoflavonifractor sp. 60 TaxID=2304576 RepID=UPI00136D9F2C
PPPTPPGPSETGTISLPDFLKAYNIKTFLKGTYQKFRLVGRGEGAKYNTEYFDSAKELTWSFVRKVLEDRGQDYISLVVEKNAGKKNPPFITAEEYQLRIKQGDSMKYRRLDVPGLENWAMYKNYGQYSWINDVLCKRILDLGLSLEDFSLEYVPSREADTGKDKTPPSPPQKDSSKGKVTTGGIVKPIRLDGKTGKQNKQPPKTGGYSFSLYGERYEGLILKNMMLTVFKTTLQRHPDQLDLLLDSLPCLREGMTISSNAQPTTFRAGENIEVAGRSISIGTSLNQAAVRQHMKKLMQLCNEPEGTLVIDGDDC